MKYDTISLWQAFTETRTLVLRKEMAHPLCLQRLVGEGVLHTALSQLSNLIQSELIFKVVISIKCDIVPFLVAALQ